MEGQPSAISTAIILIGHKYDHNFNRHKYDYNFNRP